MLARLAAALPASGHDWQLSERQTSQPSCLNVLLLIQSQRTSGWAVHLQVAWSSEQATGVAAAGTDLTLSPAQLPASGTVAVAATMTKTASGVTSVGRATFQVVLSPLPKCTAVSLVQGAVASCLSVTTVSEVFPGASFQGAVSGISGASALRWVSGALWWPVSHL